MILDPDFREFIKFLNNHEVRYLIVGGYAVAFHGHPRYTKDIDIWVNAEPDNVERLLQALNDFGFGEVGLKAEDFLVPGYVIQLGYPPNRIDLLTSMKGVEFAACYASRIKISVEGVEMCFIDLENLKRNKRAASRLQDLADVENLESKSDS
jgi:predicted nucleotidyltransferase